MNENIHLKYLMSSEKDKQWGLTVNTVGCQRIRRKEPYPPKNHPQGYLFSKEKGRILNEYQLIYIVRGKGFFTSSHCTKTSVSPGMMMLLFPSEWHTYHPDDDGWDEFWIGFKGMSIDYRMEANFFSLNHPVLDVGLHDSIIHLYEQSLDIAVAQEFGFQALLAGIVNNLLGYAYAFGENSLRQNSDSDIVIKARNYIRDYLSEHIYPEDIAKHLGLSYTSFRRFFKSYTGFSPAAYILEQKINKCKEWLTNSEYTSQEIAFQAGFDNPDYFCTVFKRKTGMTPIEYRNFTQGKNLNL